MPMISRKFI